MAAPQLVILANPVTPCVTHEHLRPQALGLGLQDVMGALHPGCRAWWAEEGPGMHTRLSVFTAIGLCGREVVGAAGKEGVPGIGVTVPTLTLDTQAAYLASLLWGAAHWGLLLSIL